MTAWTRRRLGAATLAVAALAAGCGGGGGSPGACVSGSAQTCGANSGTGSTAAPSYSTSAAAANVCTADGTKAFTRLYLEENYLWYDEIRNISAAAYTSISQYFYDLLTAAVDASGLPKDRFSFITTNAGADTLTTGAGIGYGVRFEADASGRQRVAFVDAGSPAAAAGLARGGELVTVTTPGAPSWYPGEAASISFNYRDQPGGVVRAVTLATAPVQEDPLPLVTTLVTAQGRRIGYLLFNAHTEGAQDKLITAVQSLKGTAVQDLVLDLRYNGGGYLYTALGLATMVSGPGADGQVFEQLRYNDKRTLDTAASRIAFTPQLQVGETAYAEGTPLPRLALPRVYVLATGGTCSASESVINALRGVDVEVVIVGATTCGKPYGFSRKDNCGLSYFPIEFQGTNAKGFGDYASGFAPTCQVADDFEHPLGSPSEALLATALTHAATGACGAGAAPMRADAAGTPAPARSRPLLRGKLVAPLHNANP